MKRVENHIVHSPTDLTRFMRSRFATWMDRLSLDERDIGPDPPGDERRLAQRKGVEHEARYLDALRAQHLDVYTVPPGADRVDNTLEAMRGGHPLIHEAALERGRMHGVADLLVRVEGESRLGGFHYFAREIKLAFTARPDHVVQLCAYADLLEGVQGVRPQSLEIVLGNGELVRLPTAAFHAYYSRLAGSFTEFIDAFDPDRQPVPELDADHSGWSPHAERLLERIDHLSRVAGIRRSQIKRLEAAGIRTLRDLAASSVERVERLDRRLLDRLRRQAQLQVVSAGRERPVYEVLHPETGRPASGLALLPPSSPGDVFFDMEGYPLVVGGLEYLFGATYVEDGERRFRDGWAHDRTAERAAFESFVDWVHARRRADPSMHVYHYAAYEVTALRRLMGRHATRETELDQLQRAEVFVDLYTVVRHGLMVGEPRYSIKNLERLFREARTAEVASAVDSIVQYQRWLDSGESPDWRESETLREIRDYNRDDCDSTLLLAEWLRERGREHGIEYGGRQPEPGADEQPEEPGPAERRRALAESVLGSDPDAVGRLLAHLLEFHRREEKPMWWELFRRRGMSDEELYEDPSCLGGLSRTSDPEIRSHRSIELWYRFDPDQDSKLGAGRDCYLAHDLAGRARIAELDAQRGRVRLRFGPKAMESIDWPPPRTISLIPDEFVSAEIIQASIERSVLRTRSRGALTAAMDQFLRRSPPVIDGHDGGSLLEDGETTSDAAVRLVSRMRGTTLCIQGPPGSGKTTTAARTILELLNAGHRVGVTSNGHKAVLNLMARCAERYDGELRCLKVGGFADDPLLSRIPGARHSNGGSRGAAMAREFPLVGGTAWLFSHPDMQGALDYLFIDEAGQVSLANLLGMAPAATNLVLIGDQMQLAQPIQGTHPEESGCSTLDYLLQGERTIPAERGLFLDVTYRLHPAICSLTSEAFYEGKLHSAPGCEKRSILLPGNGSVPRGSGVVFVPVEHEGNTQGSDEEAGAVRDVVLELLGCEHTDRDGAIAGRLGVDDILIVAPYNMQVRKLERILPEGARVGSVDRFQGQEAPVVIVSMCASEGHDSPRGIEFLLNPNRLNVALSRAWSLALVVGHPGLAETRCSTLDQMKRVNLYCRIVDEGSRA